MRTSGTPGNAGDVAPPGFIAVARARRPFGVHGELRCDLLTDFPERFKRGLRVQAGDLKLTVRSARLHGDDLLLGFRDIETPEAADALRGALLCVPEERAVQLPPDTYFIHDLVGLQVRTASGEDLGVVAEILPTGSNDVWVVRGEGGEVLLPALDDVILEVDLDARSATVQIPDGLLD